MTERKRQMAQLADMGIAIPEEYRGEMAMAGNWRVVSQKEIRDPEPDVPLGVGVRKRKYEGEEEEEEEEEEEAGATGVKRGWGSTLKNFPGDQALDPSELQSLLSGVRTVKKEDPQSSAEAETSEKATQCEEDPLPTKTEDEAAPDLIKREETDNQPNAAPSSLIGPSAAPHPSEVLFKKRKPRNGRPK